MTTYALPSVGPLPSLPLRGEKLMGVGPMVLRNVLRPMSMEDLIYAFHRCNRVSSLHPTPFALELQPGGGVYTTQFLPAHTQLGEVHGDPMYIWDISHTDYMMVEEDMVLDLSNQHPRSILTYVREQNASPHPANCIFITQTCHETGTNRFFLYTQEAIHMGEELVYSYPSSPYY